jgi:hypothetical protein
MLNNARSNATPWVIIAVGLAAVLTTLALQNRAGQPAPESSDGVRVVAVAGEARRVVADEPFDGAELTAVMGQSTLDLRRATLAPGQVVSIDVFALMGGLTLRVPPGWIVDTEAIPVLGGITNERGPQVESGGASTDAPPAPTLVLHGVVLLGGIVIRS